MIILLTRYVYSLYWSLKISINCMLDDVERYLAAAMTVSIAKRIKLDDFYYTIAKHALG